MGIMKIGDIACRSYDHLDDGHWRSTLSNPATLRLPEDTLAKVVAKIWEPSDLGLIVTLGTDGRANGILSPNWFLSRWRQVKGKEFKSLSDAIRELEQDAGEAARGFHHEWITLDRVDLYLCPEGHYVSSKPCPQHRR